MEWNETERKWNVMKPKGNETERKWNGMKPKGNGMKPMFIT